MAEVTAGKIQGDLDGLQHLRSARMAKKLRNILFFQLLRFQKLIHYLAHSVPYDDRDILREDNSQALVRDIPAHYIKGVGPCMFAPRCDRRTIAVTTDDRGTCPITKKGSGDYITLTAIGVDKIQTAQLDNHVQVPFARRAPG